MVTGLIPGGLQLAAPGRTQALDTMYPVGSAITFPAPDCFHEVAGTTFPTIAMPFVVFDGENDETAGFRLDIGMVPTWQTVDLYLSVFVLGGPTGVILWEVDPNTNANPAATEVPLTYSSGGPSIQRIWEDLALDSLTVGPSTAKGAAVNLTRKASDPEDTYATAGPTKADARVGSVFAVRKT